MKGKKVVVTGGSTGIGQKTVEAFLREGASVVFTARNAAKAAPLLEQYAQEVKAGRLAFFAGDVSLESDVKNLVKFTIETIGGCDILINNAGVFVGGAIHETEEKDWDFMFDVNVKGVYFTSKYFLPTMLEKGKGAIVNTSSVSGMLGEYNMAAYCAAKGALCNLTRSMALDYADKGIRVNSICPGATATPMFMSGSTEEVLQSFYNVFPSRRIGKPEEVAEAILFLASDAASFINGVNLPVAGGIMAHTGQPRQDKEAE